jgi:hypothetical protein
MCWEKPVRVHEIIYYYETLAQISVLSRKRYVHAYACVCMNKNNCLIVFHSNIFPT